MAIRFFYLPQRAHTHPPTQKHFLFISTFQISEEMSIINIILIHTFSFSCPYTYNILIYKLTHIHNCGIVARIVQTEGMNEEKWKILSSPINFFLSPGKFFKNIFHLQYAGVIRIFVSQPHFIHLSVLYVSLPRIAKKKGFLSSIGREGTKEALHFI